MTVETRKPRLGVVVAAGVAALGAVGVGLVQLRRGIIPMLDTVTYWSGAREAAAGHLFSTRLAPSFSNFDAIEFVERGGRLPFVDFPIGYPTVSGALGAMVGVNAAMQLVTLLSLAVVAALIVAGGRTDDRPLEPATLVIRAGVAILLALVPAYRLVTQATLSEPVFCAIVVALMAALLRYRRTGRSWWWAFGLGAAAGLFRFLGAPLAALPAIELWRRERHVGRALGAFAAGIAPAVVNVAWLTAAGGGHRAGWRGLAGEDVRTLARSVAGWLDAEHLGDLRQTYFGVDRGVPLWAWAVTLAWLVAVAAAVLGYVGLWPRAWPRLPAPLELCLVAAGILTTGLVIGLLGFDALVIPDNRLLLPMGVLTIAGLMWSIRIRSMAAAAIAAVAVAVWAGVGVSPQTWTELYTDERRPAFMDAAAATEADVLVTNAADNVHWFTEIPAVYLPLPERPLTGEPVDQEAELRALPCALLEHGGAIVAARGALLGVDGQAVLDDLVATGRLTAEDAPDAVVYFPTGLSCDP